jgi:radical SAM-linked protein
MSSYRYRLIFSKLAEMRFTSHLDVHRALGRTIRRANLPLIYSQGYHPKPRINIGAALPLGMTSECELADFWLENRIIESDACSTLQEHCPPGLLVHSVHSVADSEASLQTQIVAAEYKVGFIDPPDATLPEKISALLDKAPILRERRGKTYDLRPLILELFPETMDDSNTEIRMRLRASEGKTGRPEEVCLALGLDPALCLFHRVNLIFKQELQLG